MRDFDVVSPSGSLITVQACSPPDAVCAATRRLAEDGEYIVVDDGGCWSFEVSELAALACSLEASDRKE